MSPWSNNALAIGVGTREVVVGVRTSVPWRLHRRTLAGDPVSIGIPDERFGSETGVLDALRAAFAAPPDAATDATVSASEAQEQDAHVPAHGKTPPKRSAHIVLDDFWCRHAILRGDFRTLRTRELETIALAHFSDTYGIDVESLMVRFCVQPGGRALFASALSRTLYDGIHDVGAAAGVRVRSLRSCLPETLNRLAVKSDGDALLLVAADALLQAVVIERGGWAAYDAQRLFPGELGDASRLAELAEQLFERSATRAGLKSRDCTVYLPALDTDAAPFEARFAAAIRPALPALDGSPARRLMEYAP
ncbi:hypothetical protein CFB50_06255 [Burkholderia sp. AU33423]|uniref:hypothetical protein n=1 Tax=Burkholderia sp. AU33423 TaxID=2015355 RepID=UPI000B7A40B9|nr:hypothetical protein [Burkholderia sp. AU33423]OXI88146.1 hypothetical protein CFB50_06255 [Burkholderia sp. AU33423]